MVAVGGVVGDGVERGRRKRPQTECVVGGAECVDTRSEQGFPLLL